MTDESPEARAAAKWVERRFNYPAGSVSRVDFCVRASEGCPTCGYGGERANISFRVDDRYVEQEISVSAGQFIQECVALL